MPDDFQAQPPRVPPRRPASQEDRYAETSFRKQGPDWFVVALLVGTILVGMVAVLLLWLRLPRQPTPVTMTALVPPAAAPVAQPAIRWQQHPDLEARERLVGTWVAAAATIDGKECTGQELAKVKLNVESGHDDFSMVLPGYEWSGRIWVKVQEKPLRMFFVLTKPDTGARLAIYEADENLLKICVHAGPAVNPPTDFSAEKGSGRILLVMKRQ
jgi:uncharacterized protein (TIGR03067 family)